MYCGQSGYVLNKPRKLTGSFEVLYTLQRKVTAGEGRKGTNEDEALN